MSCETETAAILRGAGQKVTPQRMFVLGFLRHAGGHVTAAQVLEKVRAEYPYVNASTVYRTLTSARDLHLVSETSIGTGDTLFEWIGSDRHHHLVCRVCGRVTSVDEEQLQDVVSSLERETGFRADLDHLAILGTCADCLARATASS